MRCVKLYLPARKKIGEFRNFLSFCAKYGVDTLMLEVGGAMEYRRHPEINAAWERYASALLSSPDAAFRTQYANHFPKNAIHCENGGGSFLKQTEVESLVSYCRGLGLTVIPEVPSLTHCDYLLCAHPELAERVDDPFPDHYCPSNENTYKLLFDVLEEVVGVFRPQILNIGHDELYTIGLCPRCAGRNAEDLYVNDIIKIYSFLKERNIRTAIWADKLLCSRDKTGVPYGGNELKMIYSETEGDTVVVPAVFHAAERLPKDILLFHWHCLFGNTTDERFDSLGYDYVLSNLNPLTIPSLNDRLSKKHALGWCVSNWAAAVPDLLQRNGIYFFIACLWALDKSLIRPDTPLPEIVGKISDLLFRERLSTFKEKPLHVVHTSRIAVSHREFVDGNYMDYQKDCLGEYEILYRDGTMQREKIYFGLNINLETHGYRRTVDRRFDLFNTEDFLLESTYSCRYLFDGERTLYEYAFTRASQSEVESWRFVPGGNYPDAVKVIAFYTE